MAKPNARPNNMAMVSTASRPSNLIEMGWSTRHTKDFFQILKLAKKIINLIKAYILYYSLPPPNSTTPRMIKYCSPCVPRRSRALYNPSPIAPTLICLVVVGERVTNKEVEIWDQSPTKDRREVEIWDQSPTKDRRVWFAVDMTTAEPTKQDRRAPIKMVGGRAWSPGIYQALRLLGKSLDVAWERVFIHPLTFN